MTSHGFGTSASREGLNSGLEGLICGVKCRDLVLAVVFGLLTSEEGGLDGSELMLGGLERG